MQNMTTFNPHGKFAGNELAYITEFLDSENPKNKEMPWVARLEKAFMERFRSDFAIAHNSGTSTLHSCLVAAGVNEGDEVIVPAQTVAMVAFVVLMQKAIPVFADIDADTFNISPTSIVEKITKRTKAIIAVHMHGLMADMDPIMEIGRKYAIPVIEDSAQCVLGYYKGRLAGTIGDMASFSFEAKKHLSVGEAGMVITSNEEYATSIRKFGGLGYKTLSAGAGMRQLLPSEFQNPHYKRHDTVGLNYRMPEICAAIGLAQFERMEELVQRRQAIAEYYLDALEDCDWMSPQVVREGYVNSYWTFTVRYRGEKTHGLTWEEFYERFKKNGGDGFYGGLSLIYQEPFMSIIHPANQHMQSYYPVVDNSFCFEKGLCPVSEEIQPQLMQFKTNYRNMDVAKQQAEILHQTVIEIKG